MYRLRGWVLTIALAALLGSVLALGAVFHVETEKEDPVAFENAVLDRLRVTQRTEAAAWAASDGFADLSDGNTTVWVSRHGHTIHSRPVCGGMTAPVRTTLQEAESLGYTLCGDCW